MNNDLISVIIPGYNVEKYIEKCVKTVVNQTYTNLEIILVDDGSKDKSPELFDALAETDSRIRVIHKPNGGLSDARNAGLEVMTGRYVAFLDSDDYISENYFEILYNAICEKNATTAVCGVYKVDENDKITGEYKVTQHHETEVCTGKEIFIRGSKGDWQYVTSWGKVYDAEIFKTLRFPLRRLHEDEYTFPQIYLEQERIACVTEQMYYYLQRSDSIMGSGYSEKEYNDNIDMWTKRITYFEDDKRQDLKGYVIQSLLGWAMLYLAKFAHLMKDEEKRELKNFIKKYYWWLFKKPYLYDLSYNLKMAVKCALVLGNTSVLNKRYTH